MGGHGHHPTVTVHDDESIRLSPGVRAAGPLAQYVGIGALVLGVIIGFFADTGYFLHSYLLNFCFFLTISLGALLFVPLQHLSRAGWSVVVRRISEVMMQALLPLAVLSLGIILPTLFSSTGGLYEWTNPEYVAAHELVAHKSAYLNRGFFTLRAIVYFAAWLLIARFFYTKSVEQDSSGDKQLTLTMQSYSSWAIVVFALTVTFAAFDWIMSLDAEWFSTIFGVYVLAGCMVGFFAFLTLTVFLIQQGEGKLGGVINQEHYHDLGKYTFGFVLFWGYIAFSQFLLYWYANIPEETQWYLRRQENGWQYVSLLLLFGHFFVPFFGIMSRKIRRNRHIMVFWAVYLLVMHWIDLYYLIMPEIRETPTFGLIDVCCLVGIGGIYISHLIRVAADRPLIPVRDPRLPESLAFKNL